jgi:hypothetical protein
VHWTNILAYHKNLYTTAVNSSITLDPGLDVFNLLFCVIDAPTKLTSDYLTWPIKELIGRWERVLKGFFACCIISSILTQ